MVLGLNIRDRARLGELTSFRRRKLRKRYADSFAEAAPYSPERNAPAPCTRAGDTLSCRNSPSPDETSTAHERKDSHGGTSGFGDVDVSEMAELVEARGHTAGRNALVHLLGTELRELPVRLRRQRRRPRPR